MLRNSHFSNKETAFSGPWVVWSLLGAPGEKKRQNQMYLQDLYSPVGGLKNGRGLFAPPKESFGQVGKVPPGRLKVFTCMY